jgi:non-specific serine/threonine protein kinase/serine/threonine-protein kinase
MHDLGIVYCFTDRLEKGLPLLERTLALKEKHFGPDHPDTLVSVAELAIAHANFTGQYVLSISLFERAVNSPFSKANPHNPFTLSRMCGLGGTYALAGNIDESIKLLKQALELSTIHFGPKGGPTLEAMNGLALAYQLAGNQKQALKLHQETLDLRLAIFGPHHALTVDSMHNVAMVYEETGELDQALKLYTQVLEKWKGKFGPDYSQTLYAMDNLGAILVKLDRPGDAEALLRESFAIRKRKTPGRWETFNTQRLLGAALLGQKKHAEAEPLLVEGYTGLKERAAKIRLPLTKNTYERQSLQWFVQLYEATDRPAEAAKYRKELDAVKAKERPAGR